MTDKTIEILVRALDRALRETDDLRRLTERQAEAHARALDDAKELLVSPGHSETVARELAAVARGGKISAIKLHRQLCRTGLKEAKEAVDQYWPTEATQ